MGKARGVENAREARHAHEVDLRGGIVLPALVEPDALIAPAGLNMPRKQRESACARSATDLARYGYLAAGSHTVGVEDFREGVKMLRAIQNAHLRPLRLRAILSLPFPDPGGENRALLAGVTARWLPSAQKRRLAAVVEVILHDGGTAAAPTGTRSLVEAAAGMGFAIRFRSLAPLTGSMAAFAADAGAIAIIAPIDGVGASVTLGGSGVQVVPCGGLLDAAPAALAETAREKGIPLALSSGYNTMEPSSLNPQLMLHLATTRLGLTSEEAITALTWNAACSLRMSNLAGCLDVGRPADLISVDAASYAEMIRRVGHSDVELVMRAGRVIYERGAVS
jgi:imidazolonepropionase-like amidohydrolase